MTEDSTDRRKFLAVGGATVMAGLAGCIGPFQDQKGVPGTTGAPDDHTRPGGIVDHGEDPLEDDDTEPENGDEEDEEEDDTEGEQEEEGEDGEQDTDE